MSVTTSLGGAGGTPTILRSADEFQRLLVERGDKLRLAERGMFQGSGRATSSSLSKMRRELKMIQDEHAAQLQLLELELKRAEAVLMAAEEQQERTEQLIQRGVVSTIESAQVRRAVTEARSEVDRIRVLLELYRKAGEEVTEPQTPNRP